MKRVIFVVLLMFIGLGTILHAQVPTKEEIAKLYVATFNRAPDSTGLNYWMYDSFGGHPTLSNIAKSFFDAPETKALYPKEISNEDFINSIYSNLFNREPDTSGYNYWKAELDSGVAQRDSFILRVINGAQDSADGMDKTILNNKTRVGLSFSQAGLKDLDEAKTIMAGVNSYSASMSSAVSRFGIVLFSDTPDIGEIYHNGYTYNPIISPYTGKVWLDRNLGAERVCKYIDDIYCFGDLYQWGRETDGHEKIDSAITSIQAIDINNAGDKFIVSTPTNNDWAYYADPNGFLRAKNWNKRDGSSVCPINYRVPTIEEIKAETIDLLGAEKVRNTEDMYNSFLKVPTVIEKDPSTGILRSDPYFTTLHSSSLHSNVVASPNNVFLIAIARANAHSIRCIQDKGIIHNGVFYEEIVSTSTQRKWLDRNLGAKLVCDDSYNPLCFGDYYQWGRSTDGHEKKESATASTQAIDVNNAGSNFMIDTDNYSGDWALNADTDGRLRANNWSKTDGSSICPIDYRVPTIDEIKIENLSNSYDANHVLKLPYNAGGYRVNDNIRAIDSITTIYSNTTNGNYASYYYFTTNSANSDDNGPRANGMNVRCIKNGIVHNNITYDTIVSAQTGRTWLDRNLGAGKVCEAFNDAECYGDYYQWGREMDGHEQKNSPTTSINTVDTDILIFNNFILSNANYNNDWNPQEDSLGETRALKWSQTRGYSVCPAGYRVPTKDELNAERITNRDDAFSKLKLPAAGYRLHLDPNNITAEEDIGTIYTTDTQNTSSNYFYFGSNYADNQSLGERANGMNVRCIMDYLF